MKRHHTLTKLSHFDSRDCKCITYRGSKSNVSEEEKVDALTLPGEVYTALIGS